MLPNSYPGKKNHKSTRKVHIPPEEVPDTPTFQHFQARLKNIFQLSEQKLFLLAREMLGMFSLENRRCRNFLTILPLCVQVQNDTLPTQSFDPDLVGDITLVWQMLL